MNTMFLLYADDALRSKQTEDDKAQAMAGHRAILSDAQTQGKLKGASQLQAAKTAITVRATGGGEMSATDGPFAETKEALGGYYIIDCNDVDEAKQWAGRLARTGAISAVEIRFLIAAPTGTPVPVHAHA